MSQKVNLTLNGRTFTIACDEGQERRVQYLAQYIDKKLRDIVRSGGAHSNESYQWLLTSLLLADELLTAREELGNVQMDSQHGDVKSQRQTEMDTDAIQQLAQRIEDLAAKLKNVA